MSLTQTCELNAGAFFRLPQPNCGSIARSLPLTPPTGCPGTYLATLKRGALPLIDSLNYSGPALAPPWPPLFSTGYASLPKLTLSRAVHFRSGKRWHDGRGDFPIPKGR